MAHFFVIYAGPDQPWAEWIAWQLEAAGRTTTIQAWDFRPANNFVLEMHDAARGSEKTIMVLSKNFMAAEYTQAEWTAIFARDPTGKERRLVPVRVDDVKPDGLLSALVYIDLVGLDAEAARKRLLDGVAEARAKPSSEPRFPGSKAPRFPGPDPFAVLVDVYNVDLRLGWRDSVSREMTMAELIERVRASSAHEAVGSPISNLPLGSRVWLTLDDVELPGDRRLAELIAGRQNKGSLTFNLRWSRVFRD